MDPNIGISKPNMEKVCAALKAILAEEFGTYFKTLNYHWNIESPSFMPLHKLFGEQYEELAANIDSIAERMRQLGSFVPDVLEMANKSFANKYPEKGTAAKMVTDLLSMHEEICRMIREYIPQVQDQYKDVGTANFLTDLLEKHEKTAWFLRAHL